MSTEPKKIFLLAGKITIYLGLMAATFAMVLYLQFYQPAVIKELILSIDTFGVTPLGQEEQIRLSTINTLPITYEKKQVLTNHTVFLGATPQMVTLALGHPKEQQPANLGGKDSILYIYYLPDDPRPTILRFENEKLVQAYKGSALDLAASP